MSYQRAKLSVDANIEAYRKKVEAREAQEAREQEQEDMSIGEMIGGGIGFIVGGPGGMKAGQSIGRFAADEMSDAEDFFVTPGKFNRSETIDFCTVSITLILTPDRSLISLAEGFRPSSYFRLDLASLILGKSRVFLTGILTILL